ncbi:TetR/AcrR family transcriptional regulator [Pseudenhygromyxa sp. WMMC2535]|uniref:TetR/AcrR family transcriptional regulator n=1 Tax=Pseudenhygromyxa sp. WMMC2535 TaxID=2712867 RepID=UPI001C3E10F9|nr:TetR/AcrR family transcriptional regulator [Pseudenhygromyxa sp. WMMC2535]
MVAQIAPLVMRAAPERPSLREMAKAAGVSVNNLRHYFKTREHLLEAVFEAMGVAGQPYVARALQFTELPVGEGLKTLMTELGAAWTPDKLGGLHRSGISEGLGSARLGPAYVEHLLEPTIAVVEQMLARWAERGEIEVGDLRVAAMSLISPLLLALLHQRGLGGDCSRPLDFEPFIEELVERWLAGYAR